MHFVLLSDHIFSTEISNLKLKIILPFVSKMLLFLFGLTLLSHRYWRGGVQNTTQPVAVLWFRQRYLHVSPALKLSCTTLEVEIY